MLIGFKKAAVSSLPSDSFVFSQVWSHTQLSSLYLDKLSATYVPPVFKLKYLFREKFIS